MAAMTFAKRLARLVRRRIGPRSVPLGSAEKQALTDAVVATARCHLPAPDWNYSKSEFMRREGESVSIFALSISDQTFYLSIQVAMGIRFPKIESMWIVSQPDLKDLGHWTVEGQIPNALPRAELHFTVEEQDDVPELQPKITEIILKAGEPFWKTFLTTAELDRDWNPRPFDFARDGTNALHHATRSMIAAHLVKNRQFNELAVMRRTEIKTKLHPDLQEEAFVRFDRLMAFLHGADQANCS